MGLPALRIPAVLGLILCFVAASGSVFAADFARGAVIAPDFDRGILRLEIIGDTWGLFPIRPVGWEEIGRYRSGSGVISVVKGERYRLNVTNLTGRRIGLVIAVDGRNILSGDASFGRSTEGLYVLPAYGTGEFTGWRTNLNNVQRFYFTDTADSYAANLGDSARIGQISLTAFREVERYPRPEPYALMDMGRQGGNAPSASEKSSQSSIAKDREMEGGPGTGWGERNYSPVQETDFDAESYPAGKYFIRYEWAQQRPVRYYDDMRKRNEENPSRDFCPTPN